jgi:hypothetical protein
MSYANDITNQALEYYKNDNAELTDRKSSLTGKGLQLTLFTIRTLHHLVMLRLLTQVISRLLS